MNETIFDQINNIKQVANNYVGYLTKDRSY